MNSIQTVVHWFTHNPLPATVVFFGMAAVAVTTYTYAHDYHRPKNLG
jgi:hypothetical protein